MDLENKLAHEAASRREMVEERDRTIEKLKDNVRRSEDEIERIKDEEVKRATLLQQAVMSYVSGVHSAR